MVDRVNPKHQVSDHGSTKKQGPSRELLAASEMAQDIGAACIENAARMLAPRKFDLKSEHKVVKQRVETKESRLAKSTLHAPGFKALRKTKP